MIAELGSLALVIALAFSLLLCMIPALGIYRQNSVWIQAATWYAGASGLFIAIAYGCLTLCFLQDNFTVRYVLANSSLSLPWFYKLCAVWGGHEGSMLLWVTILAFWTVMASQLNRALDVVMRARVLVISGALQVGFILFLLCTSNPFARQFLLLDTQGKDLNPLLQDPGFLFHPPMLYMGYAGFSVAFAFALAVLWEGKLQSAWSSWVRPWTLAAWCCLTAGITLGSWWAYRELGWGGWWFWDPVENASFMPWLIGTALLHSLAVAEKREQFKAWTLLLAIMAFSLSLIGTFLVRSGVLTSVHAFAVDPQRGFYILGFLSVVTGGSLLLFACRSGLLKNKEPFDLLSRESALLLNNVLLVVIMLSVLLGTIYPLLIDGLGLGKLSVGAPYFNTIFVPLMVPLLFLMGLGVRLKWQKDTASSLKKKVRIIVLYSLVLPALVLCLLFLPLKVPVYLGMVLAAWIIFNTIQSLYERVQKKGIRHVNLAYQGMVVAHMGVAITVLGIVVSNGYGLQKDVQMAQGESVSMAGYTIQYQSETSLNGPNYTGIQTRFAVSQGEKTRYIYPEKRIYNVGSMAMTESAIDVTPFRDIYIALGEPQENHAWTVRLYYKPLVRWIWTGGFLLLLGGAMALIDRSTVLKRSSRVIQAKNQEVTL